MIIHNMIQLRVSLGIRKRISRSRQHCCLPAERRSEGLQGRSTRMDQARTGHLRTVLESSRIKSARLRKGRGGGGGD